jgi:hypothetical protein
MIHTLSSTVVMPALDEILFFKEKKSFNLQFLKDHTLFTTYKLPTA